MSAAPHLVLTLWLPLAVVVGGVAALLNVYFGYLKPEEPERGATDALRFAKQLGLVCVVAPTVVVTLMLTLSLGGSPATVVAAVVTGLLLTGVVPTITVSHATSNTWSDNGPGHPAVAEEA